jgi:hypothetical protein
MSEWQGASISRIAGLSRSTTMRVGISGARALNQDLARQGLASGLKPVVDECDRVPRATRVLLQAKDVTSAAVGSASRLDEPGSWEQA